MRFWTTHQSKTKRRDLVAIFLSYLELRGKYNSDARRRLNSEPQAKATRKGVKKSGGVSGKPFITKPLTVILNLTQRGEAVQQPFCYCSARGAYLRICSPSFSISSASKGESKPSGRSTSIFVSGCLAQTSEAATELSSTTATKTSEIQIGMLMWTATISIFAPMKVNTIARPIFK